MIKYTGLMSLSIRVNLWYVTGRTAAFQLIEAGCVWLMFCAVDLDGADLCCIAQIITSHPHSRGGHQSRWWVLTGHTCTAGYNITFTCLGEDVKVMDADRAGLCYVAQVTTSHSPSWERKSRWWILMGHICTAMSSTPTSQACTLWACCNHWGP